MKARSIVVAAFAAACGSVATVGPDASTKADGSVDASVSDALAWPDAADVVDAPYLDGPLACDAGGPCFAPPTILAANASPPPLLLAVDAVNVYWEDRHDVEACAIAGCNGSPTTLWSSTYFGIAGIAATQSSVYFTAGSQYIASCAATGCNDTPTNLLSTLNTAFGSLAADSQNVYFNDESSPATCALSGCNEAPTLYASPSNIEGLAIDATYIAWIEEGDSIEVCLKSGCNGAPTTLATSPSGAHSIAVANGVVYWASMGQADGGRNVPISKYSNGAVVACAATGCGGNPTVLASYPVWLGAGGIAADATGVFWSTEDVSGTFGEIVGCAATGCGGAPKVYATTHTLSNDREPTPGVAIDATNVYWTDQGLGAVLMTPR
jgi:hypothetical protein